MTQPERRKTAHSGSMNGAYIPLVIMAGMGLSVEAGLLGPLGEEVGHLWATLSIFGVGAALLFLISLLTGKPTEHRSFSSLPRWQLTGGLLGPVYVIMLTLATPVIGVAMTMIAILSGQVAKSLLIDHFGWFGISRKRVGVQRLLALALIVAALILLAEGA